MKSKKLAPTVAPTLVEAAEPLLQEKNMNNARQRQMRDRDCFQGSLVPLMPTAISTQMTQL